jgi:hypothetical protein
MSTSLNRSPVPLSKIFRRVAMPGADIEEQSCGIPSKAHENHFVVCLDLLRPDLKKPSISLWK